MSNIDVSIVMGSDSDLAIMSDSARIFEKFNVPYSITIASAHRTPELLSEYVQKMKESGVKVFIAGAGAAAHLPGVLASMVTLPVIGVPIQASALAGADSLYSIVQMPQGIPVATVAINGAANAGLLAVQILAVSNPELAAKYAEYRLDLKKSVQKKADRLNELGYEKYLNRANK